MTSLCKFAEEIQEKHYHKIQVLFLELLNMKTRLGSIIRPYSSGTIDKHLLPYFKCQSYIQQVITDLGCNASTQTPVDLLPQEFGDCSAAAAT